MKPIIGINCDYEKGGKHPYSFTYRDYSEAVIAAHGLPLLLPLTKENNDINDLLKKTDGLLLTGGNDVPPWRYGEEQHETTTCVHPDKDAFDSTLVLAALRMKRPILAICYGAQLLNVALGGSLIQDIPSECALSIIHKDSRNEQYTHPVTIKKDSLLHKIVGTDRIETNSAHHQAIHKLGKGVWDTAHTADGVTEAIELKDYPFLVGIQWHPERMAEYSCHAALFNALVNASK